MDRWLEEQVRQRAGGACEYCDMLQDFDEIPFEIDHILAEQHGGRTILANLALACFACNRAKGPNLAGIDSMTGRIVRLFHPRRDKWKRHFRWRGPTLVGRSAFGRATIAVLNINATHRIALRRRLINEGVFRFEE
jgi:hypothetical protein